MPTFTSLKADEVLIGRGRERAERLVPYKEMLTTAKAGRIELAKDDKASRVKHDLADAAKEVGVKVRSSWENSDQQTLFWTRSSTSPAPATNSTVAKSTKPAKTNSASKKKQQ